MSDSPRLDLPRLLTARLLLRHVEPRDAAAHLDYVVRNREHFAPWDPPKPPDFETLGHWENRLVREVADFAADRGVRFGVFLHDDETTLRGRINFSQIGRGPFQSCIAGYQIDAACEGRGLAREALAAGIEYMFNVARLHRVEANVRPENTRSRRLLERLGFRDEGLALQYLFIDGAWRDHIRMTRTNDAFEFPSPLVGEGKGERGINPSATT